MKCAFNAELIPEAAARPEGRCPVAWALEILTAARENNCGMSVFCRDGLTQLVEILTDMTHGKGQAEDTALLRTICTAMQEVGGCEMAQRAAALLLGLLDSCGDEFDSHSRRNRCAALECYYGVYIDPALCTGCGACRALCPEAIQGGEGLIHVVTDEAAVPAETFAACPVGAVKKYGLVKPRVPETPVAVGSFAEAGGRRRRRG